MTISEMHDAFKLELDKTSSLQLPAFEPEEIDYWLNRAIRQFIKNKFTGTDKGVGFEQISKRIMDLSAVVKEDVLEYKKGSPVQLYKGTLKENSYIANLEACSEEVWFIVGEEVKIGFLSLLDTAEEVTSVVSGNCYYVVSGTFLQDGITYTSGDYFIATSNASVGSASIIMVSLKRQGVTECTTDTYRPSIDNPYSEHRLHYEEAKPLRLVYQREVELITDGSYGVVSYYVRYVKKPLEVSSGIPTVDCELPDHTHDEIVVLAANLALENIEQQGRYQSHSVELNKVE